MQAAAALKIGNMLCGVSGTQPLAALYGAVMPLFPQNWLMYLIVTLLTYFALPDGVLTSFLRGSDGKRSITRTMLWSGLFTLLILWSIYYAIIRTTCAVVGQVEAGGGLSVLTADLAAAKPPQAYFY